MNVRKLLKFYNNLTQAASVGIGIVGKEGKQASLAADFSITQVI